MERHISEHPRIISAITAGGVVLDPNASSICELPNTPSSSATARAPLALLVENDPAVRDATRMLLDVEGYRVEAVASLEGAFEAANIAGRIDILVIGYSLANGENGAQVIDALRTVQGDRLKAVLLTGDTSIVTCRLPSDPGFRIGCKLSRAKDLLTLIRESLEEAKVAGAKLSVDEEVAALVVHDLRSSLSVISNVLKTCRAEALSVSVPNAGEILARQIKKSLRMAEDLLAAHWLSCAQATVEYEPVSLTKVIVEAAKDLDVEMLRREQSLALKLPRDELWIRGDALRLGQVVTNILENASKYSGRGGRIWLSARRVERQAEVRIRDNGIGIPSEDLPHIFEPYFRSRSSRCGAQDGSGLGLALARRLVELHGGTIQAKSDGPGLGTVFTVRLSVLAEQPNPLDCPER